MGRVIDDPASIFVLIRLVDFEIESSLLLEVVSLPQLSDLLDDLLAVWISALPFDRRVESVHDGVNLQRGSVIYSLQRCVSISILINFFVPS